MLGEQVGQYQITGRLGEGGMGAVYLAQHTLIGRQAAIKVLKAEFSHNPEVVDRFFNEARAASAIRHPGIVEIYDFGYHTDESAYLVMENLEGESLEARMRRLRRLPVDHAVNLIRQVASGLAAAHDKEIVHRDLKPDNIFVVPDPDIPGGERTKILDFGIAKLATQGGPGSYKTSTGTVMGTPAYMAPEQCKGAGHVDRRADLYALGCILFEMLCGQPPFVAEGGGEVMAQHIYASPPSPLGFDPSIPGEVDGFILRLLAKEADHRYQNAREVLAAIDEITRSPSFIRPGTGAGGSPAQTQPATLGVAATTPTPRTTLGAAAGSLPPRTQRRSRAAVLAPILAAGVVATAGVIFALTRNGAAPGAGGDENVSGAVAEEVADGGTAAGATGVATHVDATDAGAPAHSATAGAGAGDTAPPAVSGDIELVIDSSPRGAEVYQQPLGVRVGRTPYESKRPPAEGELVYVLKKSGYRTEKIAVPASKSAKRMVKLQKRAAADKKPEPKIGPADVAVKKPPPADKPPTDADAGRDKGRRLNPFEKKKPKKGNGRGLNPFEK